MKIRYRGDGQIILQGAAKVLKDGDVLDLPDDVAESILKSNKFFDKVEERKIKPKLVKIKRGNE